MDERRRIGSITAIALAGIGAAGWMWFRASAQRGRPYPPASAAERVSPIVPKRPSDAHEPVPAMGDNGPVGKTKPEADSAARIAAPEPFRPGETLEYTAHVSKLSNVASLSLVVHQKQEFFGRNAWHVQAFAHTQNPLRMVFVLDDQFDSYSDASSLTSLQYEMHLSERGDKVDRAFRMTTRAEPAPSNATAVRVLPGTRDPLGMLEYLRTVDWTKTPLVRCPVFDGQKLYDVQARLETPSLSVSVPAGTFSAARIAIRVFQNSAELKDTRFALSLANNEARTPLLLEAVLPFADARVELLRLP